MERGYRRESACVFVKGAGQPGVQSEWVGTTWFRRLVQKDSCLGFRSSLRTHPHMYHQRSAPSHIHWKLHVKGGVLLSSMYCATMRKSLRKCFVMHLFERSAVWCSCWSWVPLQLHMHINPGLLDCDDTTPLLRPLLRTIVPGFSTFGFTFHFTSGCWHFGQNANSDFLKLLFYSIFVILTVWFQSFIFG